MIGYLSGRLAIKNFEAIIIEVGGVGYRVEIPLSTLARLPGEGEQVRLHIHTHVREDALRLYGFESLEGLQLFERLIGVSGVGPRMALNALSQKEPATLQRAIIDADVRDLTRINGIGKRTAERIIIDLAETLKRLAPESESREVSQDLTSRSRLIELEDALKYLGYKDRDIQRVSAALEKDASAKQDIEVLLKRALRMLQ